MHLSGVLSDWRSSCCFFNWCRPIIHNHMMRSIFLDIEMWPIDFTSDLKRLPLAQFCFGKWMPTCLCEHTVTSMHALLRRKEVTFISVFWSVSIGCSGLPGGQALVVKNPPANAGDRRDAGSISDLERYHGGEHGKPLQYSCLKNPMDRGAWQATVRRVAKGWNMTEVTQHTHTRRHRCCSGRV